jgi:hypothetical protein
MEFWVEDIPIRKSRRRFYLRVRPKRRRARLNIAKTESSLTCSRPWSAEITRNSKRQCNATPRNTLHIFWKSCRGWKSLRESPLTLAMCLPWNWKPECSANRAVVLSIILQRVSKSHYKRLFLPKLRKVPPWNLRPVYKDSSEMSSSMTSSAAHAKRRRHALSARELTNSRKCSWSLWQDKSMMTGYLRSWRLNSSYLQTHRSILSALKDIMGSSYQEKFL